MVSLNQAAKIILKKCFRVKNNERVLVISDDKKSKIGRFLFEEAKKISDACYVEMKERKRNGTPPPKIIEAAMMQSDVIIFATQKSLSHTIARKNANSNGARIASMPGITQGMLMRCIDVNYTLMKKRSEKLSGILSRGASVRLKTKLGSDLIFSIKGRNAIPDYGDLTKKCSFDNLPSGETFIAPVEGTTNGVFIVDVCMCTGLLKKPVKITVKNGFAVKFEGFSKDQKEAKKIKDLFKGLPKKAFSVAEFGIGTNENAKKTGNVLEDEKIYGTCHIALGNNISFGGKVNVPIHIDGIIQKPDVYVDGKKIICEGKLI